MPRVTHTIESTDLALLLQWLDSAFPCGAFAHSNGLEAAVHAGAADDIEAALTMLLRQQLRLTLPLMAWAWREPASAVLIDARLDCLLSNHVAQSASVAQGRGLVSATARVFGTALEGAPPRHLPTAFGVLARRLGFAMPVAAIGYGFAVARGLCAAAVRLGATGTFDAQRLLRVLMKQVEHDAGAVEQLLPDDAVQIAPLSELWQASHDRLYSRLFLS